MAEIKFSALAASALECAERLLLCWLPGGNKVGHEWKACNPLRADQRAGSFSVSLTNGRWADFATDDKGGDLLELCAYLRHSGNRVEAAKELAIELNMPDAIPPLEGRGRAPAQPASKPAPKDPPVSKKPTKPADDTPGWVIVLPVPDDAPPPPRAHEFRGIPESTWCYRDANGKGLGFVYRFRTSDGGKEIVPLTYWRREDTGRCAWRWVQWPTPRPLYGLDRLATKPEATVLLVEGEKCADAGNEELADLAVVSWPGGGKAWPKCDFSALAGRKVITFADADAKRVKLSKADAEAGVDPNSLPLLDEDKQPGVKTMAGIREILRGMDCRLWNVEIPAPGEKPDGWDIADAITEGLKGEALANWIRERSKLSLAVVAPQTAPDPAQAGAGGQGNGGDNGDHHGGGDAPGGPPEEHWRWELLRRKGEIVACLSNVYLILANHPAWQGVLAWDEFAQRTVKLVEPPYEGGCKGEWEANDDSMTAIWLTRNEYLTASSATVAEGVETLAKHHPIHPVRDWLRGGLPKWDGAERAHMWLCDYLGVTDTPYVRLVARYYLMGMVMRVLKPGCKFDYCLVLEGKQGKGKSTALRLLAGDDWYGDTDLDLQNKDSMSGLRGKWLYEFSEMGSVTRAESSKQKSFLSRMCDEYRPVYGRREIKAPRQVVFAGTTNEWEWNKDPTGGRRFWPVECADEIVPDGLVENRGQLFAEALAYVDRGDRFWPNAQEQADLFDPEQIKREMPESLVDALHDWVYSMARDFSAADAMLDGLKLDASKMTRDMQTRVGIALRKLGCTRVEKRNGMVRYWYKPPVRNGAKSNANQPEGGLMRPLSEGGDADF